MPSISSFGVSFRSFSFLVFFVWFVSFFLFFFAFSSLFWGLEPLREWVAAGRFSSLARGRRPWSFVLSSSLAWWNYGIEKVSWSAINSRVRPWRRYHGRRPWSFVLSSSASVCVACLFVCLHVCSLHVWLLRFDPATPQPDPEGCGVGAGAAILTLTTTAIIQRAGASRATLLGAMTTMSQWQRWPIPHSPSRSWLCRCPSTLCVAIMVLWAPHRLARELSAS